MPIVDSSNDVVTLYDGLVAGALGDGLNRFHWRHHVVQVTVNASGAAVTIQASLDGNTWADVGTVNTVGLLQLPDFYPYLRVKRGDAALGPNAQVTVLLASALYLMR